MGGRSRVAAQLLEGKGFSEIYNLEGGIMAWQGLKAAGPVEVGMVYIRGDETPSEIIAIAYGMEEGLRSFYETMASRTADDEVASMFTKLSGIEERHKERLFRLQVEIDPTTPDMTTFESSMFSKALEGGLTTDEFLELNKPAMQTVPDVLNMAMMLETQALDLYLRYSERTKEEKTRTVLFEVAEEEKAHLKSLGHLMDRKI